MKVDDHHVETTRLSPSLSFFPGGGRPDWWQVCGIRKLMQTEGPFADCSWLLVGLSMLELEQRERRPQTCFSFINSDDVPERRVHVVFT